MRRKRAWDKYVKAAQKLNEQESVLQTLRGEMNEFIAELRKTG